MKTEVLLQARLCLSSTQGFSVCATKGNKETLDESCNLFYNVYCHMHLLGKIKFRVFPTGDQPIDLPITSSDALPLSLCRLVGDEPLDKRPAYFYDQNVDWRHICHGRDTSS